MASEKDMATLCADCGRASGRAGGSLVAERAALIQSILSRLSARRAKLFATLSSSHEKQLQRQLRSAIGKPTSALENPRFDRISSGRTASAALGDRERDQWARDGYGDQKQQQRGVGGFEDAALRRRQALERLDLLRNLRLPAQDEQQPDLNALGGERERAEKAAQLQSLDCLALLEEQWETVRFPFIACIATRELLFYRLFSTLCLSVAATSGALEATRRKQQSPRGIVRRDRVRTSARKGQNCTFIID